MTPRQSWPAASHGARGSRPKCILGLNTVFRGPRIVQPARTRSMVRSGLTLPRLRRLSQTLFLGLFLVLLYKTGSSGTFLKTDPLIAIANALATHALYRGLLWSLAI